MGKGKDKQEVLSEYGEKIYFIIIILHRKNVFLNRRADLFDLRDSVHEIR